MRTRTLKAERGAGDDSARSLSAAQSGSSLTYHIRRRLADVRAALSQRPTIRRRRKPDDFSASAGGAVSAEQATRHEGPASKGSRVSLHSQTSSEHRRASSWPKPGAGRGAPASRMVDRSSRTAVAADSLRESELLGAVDAALRVRTKQAASVPRAQPGSPTAAHAAKRPGSLTRVRQWSGRAEDYILSKQRLDAVAPGGILLLTWANHHYLDFAMNWVGHLQLLGVTAYMVGALDDELLKDLVEMGVDNTFAMQTTLKQGDLSWGSPHFFEMGREKIQLIERFASLGFDVIVSDIDTVWLKDPIPYMARFPEADILASSDHMANTTAEDGLEKFPEAGSPCNIGVLLFRKSALGFAKEWNEVLANDSLYWDQNAFNDLMRRNMDFSEKRPDRLFKGYGRKLLVGILPVALFASGHTFYVQDLAAKMGFEPFVVHGTFQFSGTVGKRHRFRERQIWLPDGPEYFDPPGGLVSFDLRVAHLLEPASHLNFSGRLNDFTGHFNLINAQLLQVRNALAVASALGRTLVLPRMYTGADRWWAPHLGLIPGSHGMRVPFLCPSDHILDLHEMARDQNENDVGPSIAFREYSFLDNKRSAHVAADRLRVTICAAWDDDCAKGAVGEAVGSTGLRLQHGLNDEQLRAALQAYNNTKVLHFDDLSAGIGTFSSQADFEKFQRRTKVYASIWCCVDKHPGHVWYDMWWDQPHVDRHNRQFATWEPLTGP